MTCLSEAKIENGMRILVDSIFVGGTELPITTLFPQDFENANLNRILIAYGGTKDELFSDKVKNFWGPVLTGLGFVVHCFDYRSNLNASRFYEYGLNDRLIDLASVSAGLKGSFFGRSISNPFSSFPLSIMGVSMGGYLAAFVAAEFAGIIDKLILVAPAAYNDAALSPDIKFGPDFSQIIRRPNSWRSSSVFSRAAPKIKADCLIVTFENDDVVPSLIPTLYVSNLSSAVQGARFIESRVVTGSPGHKGTFDNTDRRDKIARLISDFFTG
ncbi:MAG: hypothetical protein WED06_02545 [Candidatus Paceibacterota bacterium]